MPNAKKEDDYMTMDKKWELVWSEEFDQSQIDTNVWNYELGYIRNLELQYYTSKPENSYIENGELVLEAREEEYKGFKYTSASINTKNKKNFLYGKLEMRARLPFGKGIWPAFWSLGAAFEGDSDWPVCGEIDIMELVGGNQGDATIYANLHSPNPNGEEHMSFEEGNTFILEGEKFNDNYHIIGIEWNEKEIKWYVDDKYYFHADISNIPCFHKEQFILLNLAVGGRWPGDPDENTVFPQSYHIDWIRYYREF
jgi:beta-glucanase (GH16 family)